MYTDAIGDGSTSSSPLSELARRIGREYVWWVEGRGWEIDGPEQGEYGRAWGVHGRSLGVYDAVGVYTHTIGDASTSSSPLSEPARRMVGRE